MREKEWHRKNTEEKIISSLLLVIWFIWMLFWVPISFIVKGLAKFTSDVARGAYGKLVNWAAGILFIAAMGWVFTLVSH